jgi:lysophospholipase
MPILVADERSPGDLIISLNATVFEFNPFEMGSFDPTTYGFAPLKYIGSNFTKGELPPGRGCVAGFDNLGFVMGTSSSLFNQIFLALGGTDTPDILTSVITKVLARVGKDQNDIADFTPNPFLGYHPDTNPSAASARLSLVDGGEDLQNIPLNPVIQPMRQVDVVFAVDSSADTVEPSAAGWPNGTALVATFERAETSIMNKTSFPYIPGYDTFVALGLNNKPTFFGCDGKNVTSGDNIPPLIVYVPNAPYTFLSNTSTFAKLDYTLVERSAMIENGYNVATQANGTAKGASNWPTCVACAMLSRSLDRNGETVPKACQDCFKQYCWNGTVAAKSEPYFPSLFNATAAAATDKENKAGKFAFGLFGRWLPVAVAGVIAM